MHYFLMFVNYLAQIKVIGRFSSKQNYCLLIMLESSDLLESGANTDVVPRIDPSAVRRCNGMD